MGRWSIVGLLVLIAACAPAPPANTSPAASKPPPASAAGAAAATAAPAKPTAAPAGEPTAPATVRLGVLSGATDAGFFIGLDLGYYQEQGLTLEMTTFDSAARMVAPLGAGQLDVGAGAHSAGLFNAIARGVGLKIVADKGSSWPGSPVLIMMFRRDLVDSGRLRTPADLKGMRVALPARGITTETLLVHWLRQAGLSLDDVEVVELGFPDHGAALAGGAVEAIISVEPFVTRILEQNLATIYQSADQIYPGFQSAVVIYSMPFVESQPDAARRFMIAYLRAVRYYNDAYRQGDPAKRAKATEILARYTPVKDLALYERMYMPGINPDGRVNRASVADDQEIWLASGVQQARINLDEVIDESFVQAALQVLGPYR